MIFVFKTSVNTKRQAQALKPHIDNLLPTATWNFDLADIDNILRIDSEENIVLHVIALLQRHSGRERVYVVEPTGSFEHDPNVTDKKFPGNPTRSYRTTTPLKIVGEVTEWARQTPQHIQQWREKLDHNKGEIIN